MTEPVLGLRFTADQRELQQASDKGVENIKRIGDAAKKSNEEAARAAQQHTEALKRQSDTLGMTRSQVLAYEAAQHKMNDVQRQSAAASISAIDAYEKKEKMLNRVRVAAGLAGAALGAAFVAGAKASITAATEAEQAQLRLEAVLRGTRYAAGLSGSDLDRMAGDMQGRLGIDDEEIKKSMATLLTFRQVRKESFGEALEVAANISAVMGTDLQSATMQLGKALENPEEGLTALTRSGVTFNATQREMIKSMAETGDQAGAITAMLRIMKEQGLDKVKESMNTGLGGASNKLKIANDELLESIGKSDIVSKPWLATMQGLERTAISLKNAFDGGLTDALISFSTFGLVTPKVKVAPQTYADGFGESMAMRRGAQVQQQNEAREKANQFLAQFKTDNEKFAEEVKQWKKIAAASGFDTAQTADGEAKIAAKYAKKGSSESTAGAQLITSLTDQLQQASGEGSTFDKVMRQITDGTKKYTDAEIATAAAIAGEIDERKRARKEIEDGVAAYDRDQAKRKASDAVIADLTVSLSMQAQQLQTEIDLMGLSDAQRDKTIALRELENKFIKARIGLDGEALAQSYEMERIERERIGGLLDQRGAMQARKKAQEDALAENRRFNDELARGLTDSIFRGFDGGKSFATNFWDAMKNMAKTTVLQPVVKFLVSPLTGAFTAALGSMGIPGLANAAGGTSSAGGTGSMGNMLGWITNSGDGGGISGMAGMMTGGFDSIFQSAGVGMGSQFVADIGNYGMGMPVVGGLLQMATGNVKGGAGSMIGGAIGSMFGPIGTVVGSALGSALGSMIGGNKKPASFTGMDVNGTVSRAGLTGASFYGNDANQGYRWQTTDHWATAPFNAHVTRMFDDLEKIGKTLGLDTSSLNTTSVGFSASGLSNMNSQQIADEMAAQLGAVSDQLALQLMPNLKAFAQANETLTQTLVRLAEAQRQVDLQEIFGSMQGALQLADETRGLWLSDLSPLTAQQRLAEASGRYGETLSAAQGGDLQAMGQLSGMARTYLGEARGYYASSGDYTDIFNQVQGEIGNLVEDTLVEQSMAFSEMNIPLAQIADNTKDMDKRIAAALEAAIAARGEANDAAVKAQTEALIRANEDLARTLQSFIDARVLQ
jgi:hypothetical protein